MSSDKNKFNIYFIAWLIQLLSETDDEILESANKPYIDAFKDSDSSWGKIFYWINVGVRAIVETLVYSLTEINRVARITLDTIFKPFVKAKKALLILLLTIVSLIMLISMIPKEISLPMISNLLATIKMLGFAEDTTIQNKYFQPLDQYNLYYRPRRNKYFIFETVINFFSPVRIFWTDLLARMESLINQGNDYLKKVNDKLFSAARPNYSVA